MKKMAYVIVEEGKEPRGWQLAFLEENFQSWSLHTFSRGLSKNEQKRAAMIYKKGEDIVLASGKYEFFKKELMKIGATIYDLDL